MTDARLGKPMNITLPPLLATPPQLLLPAQRHLEGCLQPFGFRYWKVVHQTVVLPSEERRSASAAQPRHLSKGASDFAADAEALCLT